MQTIVLYNSLSTDRKTIFFMSVRNREEQRGKIGNYKRNDLTIQNSMFVWKKEGFLSHERTRLPVARELGNEGIIIYRRQVQRKQIYVGNN